MFLCYSLTSDLKGATPSNTRSHQVYEEFLPVIPPEMEVVVQDLMTYTVNLTHIVTERSLFVEIVFVFVIPNKGNSLLFSFTGTFSWNIHLYIFTFFLFVCLYKAWKKFQNNV